MSPNRTAILLQFLYCFQAYTVPLIPMPFCVCYHCADVNYDEVQLNIYTCWLIDSLYDFTTQRRMAIKCTGFFSVPPQGSNVRPSPNFENQLTALVSCTKLSGTKHFRNFQSEFGQPDWLSPYVTR